MFIILKSLYSLLITHLNVIKYVNLFLFAMIFLVQGFVSKYLTVALTTDDLRIKSQAFSLAAGSKIWDSYFYQFPNNVNVTVVYSWLIRLFQSFHVQHVSLMIVLTLFLMTDLAIFVTYKSVKLVANKEISGTFFLIFIAGFFPIYTYALNFYTDPLVILFPALGFYWLLKQEKTDKIWSKSIYFVLAVFSLCVGYLIKPNVIIIILALIIAIFINFFQTRRSWILNLSQLGLVLLICTGFVLLSNQIKSVNQFHNNSQEQVPSSAFIYMALNPTTDGQISSEMYKFQNIKSVSKRDEKINVAIQKRLVKMNGGGILAHFWRKFVFTFSRGVVDGDGPNLQSVHHTKISRNLKQFAFWGTNLTQVLYVITLVGMFFFASNPKRLHESWTTLIAVLSILGVIAFHTVLWEAEARYAFLILLFILTLGSVGIVEVFAKMNANNNSLFNYHRSFFNTVICAVALVGFTTSWSLTNNKITNQNVVAQQSGIAYGLKQTFLLKGGQNATQNFTATNSFSMFKIPMQIFSNKKIKVFLVDKTQNSYVEMQQNIINGNVINNVNGHAGRYQIKILNSGKQTVRVDSLNFSPHYSLSSGGYLNNGHQIGFYLPFSSYSESEYTLIQPWILSIITILGLLIALIQINIDDICKKKKSNQCNENCSTE
ncbi:hypothetical protein LROSRS0_0969 [Furfurilactobacillus rossiae]|nr:hypothetical protein LR814_00165 [Furfurilactobacillus rossiae]QLE61016.1 hypothetical protein LROSRS0_0969 [Furfurilactobacillus rossiae]